MENSIHIQSNGKKYVAIFFSMNRIHATRVLLCMTFNFFKHSTDVYEKDQIYLFKVIYLILL